MALTLPNNLVFVPLDVLTAEELNELMANITFVANQFPIASANIANNGIKGTNVDWSTMKKWVPDYANKSSTNLVNNKKATITETGFVFINIRGYDFNLGEVHLYINGQEVWYSLNEVAGSSATHSTYRGIFLPVASGDVITLSQPDWLDSVYFIPGKFI